MSKDRKLPKCGNRKDPPYKLKEEILLTKIIVSQIWERSETHLRKLTKSHQKPFIPFSFGVKLGNLIRDLGFFLFPFFFFSLGPRRRKKTQPHNQKQKPSSLSLFIHSCLASRLCILLNLTLSLIHARRTGVGDTQQRGLTFLRTNQTVATDTTVISNYTKNGQIRKVARESEREREREREGVLLLLERSDLTPMAFVVPCFSLVWPFLSWLGMRVMSICDYYVFVEGLEVVCVFW